MPAMSMTATATNISTVSSLEAQTVETMRRLAKDSTASTPNCQVPVFPAFVSLSARQVWRLSVTSAMASRPHLLQFVLLIHPTTATSALRSVSLMLTILRLICVSTAFRNLFSIYVFRYWIKILYYHTILN